jgi:hypothetical protein
VVGNIYDLNKKEKRMNPKIQFYSKDSGTDWSKE